MEAIPNQRSIIVELPLIVPDENEREIEVKLRNYFHSKHGDECDVQFREECVTGSRYTVAFVEESGVDNVLARPYHEIDIDGHLISIEVQRSQAPPVALVSSTSQVSCDVPSCRALPGLGIPHLTDSSNRRGSDDMYGEDEHHQAHGARLLGQNPYLKLYQTPGNVSGTWAPWGGTMDSSFLPIGFQGYPWSIESITNKNVQHLLPNQPLEEGMPIKLTKGNIAVETGSEEKLQSLNHSSRGATRGVTGCTNTSNMSTAAATVEQPANWTTMENGELTKMVTLTAGTAEHSFVENHFRSSNMSAFNRIVEIQRVQNQRLYIQYQIHKAALEICLKRSNVEKVLFHGTDEQTCNVVSRHGFNRSFSGRNAAFYGDGTYFAVQAWYSARRVFARPNAYGIKHILMTKVLVGDFIRGYQGMITPPNNPRSPGEFYDSLVDNVNDPSVYVISHDAQAYPEYIIKFM